MIEIIPGLWLGGFDEVHSIVHLGQKYRTILNVSALEITRKYSTITYFDIPIKKNTNTNYHVGIFDTTNRIIDNHIHGGILINCKRGKHRSATVVVAYLMHRYGFSLHRSVNYVRMRKPEVFSSSIYMLEKLLEKHTD